MANSDYFTTVTRVCLQTGILAPDTRAQFNDNTQMSAPTLKAKLFVDTSNRMLLRRLNKLFMKRSFNFNTVSGQSDYDTDPLTHVEGIEYHTMRNNTTGADWRIQHINYDEYRDLYTDLTTVPQQKPTLWTDLATDSAQGATARTNKIRLIPTPDAIYNIEYWAKIVAQPLANDTDIISWPPEYEDVLWTWAGRMLEKKLGVDATMEDYAEQALDSMRAWATGPTEQRQAIRLGVKIKGGKRYTGGYYDTTTYTAGW